MMVATTSAYSLSMLARLSGARKAGVAFSNLGMVLLSAGAYLGGDEVFDLGYGVNHTAFTHGPTDFVPVLARDDLDENRPTKVDAKGTPVVLVRQGDSIFALDDTCAHAGCSLAGGSVQGRSIICPCHGSEYDLADGSVIHGPATVPEPWYETRVQSGMVEVRLGSD
jgi:nitrite reductase/ring-hydroxylating ferredoxin subunit